MRLLHSARNAQRVLCSVIPGKPAPYLDTGAGGRDPESTSPPLDSSLRWNDGLPRAADTGKSSRQNLPRNSCARSLVIALLCMVVFFPGVGFAKSLYVSGYREVGVRTSPDAEGAVMVTLKTGDEVTLVNSTGEYYLITLSSGSRGYVQKVAMTEQEPAEVRLQKLDQKTQQQIKDLQAKTEEQDRQLAMLRQDRGQLDNARKQAETKASEQAKRAAELQAQQDGIVRDFYIQWFLAGAGVLGAGFLLGWIWRGIIQRSRRTGLSFGR